MPIIQHLIIDHYGAFLGKHQGRLRVIKDREVLVEAPLLHLEQVLVTSRGVSLSADAVRACCTAGIPIFFLDESGRPYANLYAAGLTGTVLTRREQLLAGADRRGVALAHAFAEGKIANQAGFLRYAAKYRAQTDPALHRQLRQQADRIQDHIQELRQLDGESPAAVREQVLSVEGRRRNSIGRHWRGSSPPHTAGLDGKPAAAAIPSMLPSTTVTASSTGKWKGPSSWPAWTPTAASSMLTVPASPV
jgi:CRISPR-associated protein Cas1